MKRGKYFYNEKTLSYQKVRSQKGYMWFQVMGIISFGFIVFLTTFLSLSEEELPERNLAMYERQFEIMNEKSDKLQKRLDDLVATENEVYREVFGLDSISEDVRIAGIGGVNDYEYLTSYSKGELVIDIQEKMDKLNRQFDVQDKSYKEILKAAHKNENSIANIPAIQPVSNKSLKRMASGYGYRIDPFYRTRRFHAGMDFTAKIGTPVYATANGVVKDVERKYGGYGRNIVVDHKNGYTTRYAHLSKSIVKIGQKVVRGEKIGEVGSTGKSTGAHLHYEVRLHDEPLDPANFYFNDLTNEEYEAMLKLAALKGRSFD